MSKPLVPLHLPFEDYERVAAELGGSACIMSGPLADLYREAAKTISAVGRALICATCDGVWHVTLPRESACPKCGQMGSQVFAEPDLYPRYGRPMWDGVGCD